MDPTRAPAGARVLLVEDDPHIRELVELHLQLEGLTPVGVDDVAEGLRLAKADPFDLLILDDISYVRKDQAETSVLFELIAERYERRSLLITANQPFSGWDQVFPDVGMTVAAIDRLVHHSTIFELNVESYRRKKATSDQQTRRDSEKQKAKQPRQTAGTE